jgi:predicted chitinase
MPIFKKMRLEKDREPTMQLTRDQPKAVMPHCNADRWIGPLNVAMEQFEVNTPTHMAAFLAQLAHE